MADLLYLLNNRKRFLTSLEKEIENKCNDAAWKKGLKWNENDKNSISSEEIVNILL